MKKLLLFVFFSTMNLLLYGQNWQQVQIDSVVACKLPAGWQKNTEGNKLSWRATSGFGNIMIFKTEDNPRVIPDMEKDRHLKAYYNDYVANVRKSAKGSSITDERDTVIDELRFKDFKLQTDSGSGKQYRDFRIFHVNGATYTFEFLYNDIQREYAIPERTLFFNAISVDEQMGRKDQFTHNDNPKPGAERRRNLHTGLIIGTTILIVLIFIFVRRRKD